MSPLLLRWKVWVFLCTLKPVKCFVRRPCIKRVQGRVSWWSLWSFQWLFPTLPWLRLCRKPFMAIICWHTKSHIWIKLHVSTKHWHPEPIVVDPRSINLCGPMASRNSFQLSASEEWAAVTGRWRHSPACFLCGAPTCSLWSASELLIYMLPFIFTNVTRLLCRCPDAHKERIYNFSIFWGQRIIRSLWHSGEKSPSRLCILLPSSPPPSFLPSLLPLSACSALEYGPVC